MAPGQGPCKECEWKQGVSGGLEYTEDVTCASRWSAMKL